MSRSKINQDVYGRILSKIITGCGEFTKTSDDSKLIIESKYGHLIKELIHTLPHRHSGTVGGAIIKCALIYGTHKVKEFVTNIKNGKFSGNDDPAFLLWTFLSQKKKGQKLDITDDIYRKTITACRAYCEGRTLKVLKPVDKDLFEWEANFTVPKNKIKYDQEIGPIVHAPIIRTEKKIPEKKPTELQSKEESEQQQLKEQHFKEKFKECLRNQLISKNEIDWDELDKIKKEDSVAKKQTNYNLHVCKCGEPAIVFRQNKIPICGKCYIQEHQGETKHGENPKVQN